MKQTFTVIIFLFLWNYLVKVYGECNTYILLTDQTHIHCTDMDERYFDSNLGNLIKIVSYGKNI